MPSEPKSKDQYTARQLSAPLTTNPHTDPTGSHDRSAVPGESIQEKRGEY